ncbi:hypothetical protein A45J_0610 [hot springs metagenome]|uniref:Uncharacterized protein n=1 Tax=hot springs metagenome TaxID=433727 RepID=A0A5J4L3N7_9ZZZZ
MSKKELLNEIKQVSDSFLDDMLALLKTKITKERLDMLLSITNPS